MEVDIEFVMRKNGRYEAIFQIDETTFIKFKDIAEIHNYNQKFKFINFDHLHLNSLINKEEE